jgi:uncharacterized protein YdgA (DUF945 family)
MKKLVGILGVIIVLVLVGYYGMGLMTERSLNKDVALVNQSDNVRVEVKQYDRGWFASKADLQWKLTLPERASVNQQSESITIPAQSYTMQMPLAIYHGPIIFAKDGVHFGLGYASTNLDMPQELKQKFTETFSPQSTQPKIDLSVLVNYMNRSRLTMAIPEFALISKNDDGKFNWHGLISSVTVNAGLNRINGDFVVNGVDVSKGDMSAKVGKVTSEYNLHEAENGLMLGDGSFSMPSALLQKGQQKQFELSSLHIQSSSDVVGGLFHSSLKASVESIYSDGKTYGPANVDLSLKNIDAEVLARINEQANKLQGGTEQQQQQALFAIIPELPKLFGKGAELELSNLNVTMPEGNVEGNLSVNLPEGQTSNPFELIQKINGEGSLTLPQSIVKSMLKEVVKQQLIKKPTLQDALAKQMKKSVDTSTTQPSVAETNSQVSDEQNVDKTDDMQNADTTSVNQVQAPSEDNNETSGTDAQNKTIAQQPITKPVTPQMTLAELDQSADAKANEKLKALIDAGTLKQQGDAFVIHVTLNGGQFEVNGKPFNPAMIQF